MGKTTVAVALLAAAHVLSPVGVQDYWERTRGFRLTESELRQDGRPCRMGDNNRDPATRTIIAAYSTEFRALTQKQEDALRDAVPTARIVTLPNANHSVFVSNENEVLERNTLVHRRAALASEP